MKLLESENKALRAAIAHFPERVERWKDDDFFGDCPDCGSLDEHKPKCVRNLIPERDDDASQDKLPDIGALGSKLAAAASKDKKPLQFKKSKLPGIQISWRIDR